MQTSRLLQPEHFEYRYLVPGDEGEEMEELLGEYLDWDEHGLELEGHAYPVHDYYLDNHDWDIYWRSLEVGARNPHLRFRCYGRDPEGSIYAETKRHLHDRVVKHSTVIPRADIELLLSGLIPDREDLPPGPAPEVDLEHFCHSLSEHEAVPRVHVTFEREAWRNEDASDDHVRVTLDHHCRCQRMDESSFPLTMESPHELYPGRLVLELKFTEGYPDWFRELFRRFECPRIGTPKFIRSAQLLGGPRMSSSETTIF